MGEDRQKYLYDLNLAIAEEKFSSSIGDIWQMAQAGRGRLLLIEEDFHYPAKVDESGSQIKPADELKAPDVLDDAVDEVVTAMLDKGGGVVFLENG